MFKLIVITFVILLISLVANSEIETHYCDEREPCGWAKYTSDDVDFIEYTIKGTCTCNPETHRCALSHQDFSTETHVYLCQDLNNKNFDDNYWMKK